MGISYYIFNNYFSNSIIYLIFYLFIISCFIIILFSDLKYYIIPDKVIFIASSVTLIFLLLTSRSLILNHLISAIVTLLFFYIIYYITKGKGMGFGDVKLVFWIGLLLGFPGVLIAMYLAFFIGAFFSLILVILKYKKLKGGVIQFGPFILLGAFITIIFGSKLWYFVLNYMLSR